MHRLCLDLRAVCLVESVGVAWAQREADIDPFLNVDFKAASWICERLVMLQEGGRIILVGPRGAARAEDVQGKLIQRHLSSNVLGYEYPAPETCQSLRNGVKYGLNKGPRSTSCGRMKYERERLEGGIVQS